MDTFKNQNRRNFINARTTGVHETVINEKQILQVARAKTAKISLSLWLSVLRARTGVSKKWPAI
jgi:hypothetical protein